MVQNIITILADKLCNLMNFKIQRKLSIPNTKHKNNSKQNQETDRNTKPARKKKDEIH